MPEDARTAVCVLRGLNSPSRRSHRARWLVSPSPSAVFHSPCNNLTLWGGRASRFPRKLSVNRSPSNRSFSLPSGDSDLRIHTRTRRNGFPNTVVRHDRLLRANGRRRTWNGFWCYCKLELDGPPIRMALAKRIIAQAQTGERDPERLCEGALQGVSPVLRPSPSGE